MRLRPFLSAAGRCLWMWGGGAFAAALLFARCASAVPASVWSDPGLSLFAPRDDVTALLGAPDSLRAEGALFYRIEGSEELLFGMLGFFGTDELQFAAQVYRPKGTTVDDLVRQARRAGAGLIARDGEGALLVGGDPAGRTVYYVFLAPDPEDAATLGPVAMALAERVYPRFAEGERSFLELLQSGLGEARRAALGGAQLSAPSAREAAAVHGSALSAAKAGCADPVALVRESSLAATLPLRREPDAAPAESGASRRGGGKKVGEAFDAYFSPVGPDAGWSADDGAVFFRGGMPLGGERAPVRVELEFRVLPVERGIAFVRGSVRGHDLSDEEYRGLLSAVGAGSLLRFSEDGSRLVSSGEIP